MLSPLPYNLDSSTCTLCHHPQNPILYEGQEKSHGQMQAKRYYQCNQCELIYLDPQLHLAPEAEKQRYETHHNYLDDPQYLNFLKQLWSPLQKYLQAPETVRGLDFGSGPTDVLAQYIQAQGYTWDSYDPFFGPDSNTLQPPYDVITCTEVVEHFRTPSTGWDQLNQFLSPQGHLGIMTQLYDPQRTDFQNWKYRQDDTHISFYTIGTLQWISQHYNWDVLEHTSQMAIFKKIPDLSTYKKLFFSTIYALRLAERVRAQNQ